MEKAREGSGDRTKRSWTFPDLPILIFMRNTEKAV